MANKRNTKTARQNNEHDTRVDAWHKYTRERASLKKKEASLYEIQRRSFINKKLSRIAPLIGYTFIYK